MLLNKIENIFFSIYETVFNMELTINMFHVYISESKGKLSHLFIPGKTATLVPEFVVEDLPLGRTAVLIPEFAVEDLPLGRTAALVPEFAVEDRPLGRTAALVPEFAVEDLPLG